MKAIKFFPVFSTFLFFLCISTAFSQIGYSPKIDSLINLVTAQSITPTERKLSGDTSCIIGGSPYTIVSRYWNNASNSKATQFIF